MEKTTVAIDAIASVFKLQADFISKISNPNFRFEFTIDPKDRKFVLSTRNTFHFFTRTKDKKDSKGIFKGEGVVEAAQKFVDFFVDGGEGKVTVDHEGYQLHAKFHWNKKEGGWVITDVYTGRYYCKDSLDD
jgi:hypothetical protein